MDREKTEQVTIRLKLSALKRIEEMAELEHLPRATKLAQLIYLGLEVAHVAPRMAEGLNPALRVDGDVKRATRPVSVPAMNDSKG